MTPEGRVKKAVKAHLNELDLWYYMPVQNGMGRVGIPDFICCVPVTITEDMVGKRMGAFVGIETKAPGKRGNTTANQKRELSGIDKAAGATLVTDDAAAIVELLLRVYMLTGGEQDTAMAKSSKAKLEYQREYNAKPENVKKRVMNNAARRDAIREGRAEVGDGTEVDHKKPLRKGGSNARSNLRVVPESENAAWRKGKRGYDR